MDAMAPRSDSSPLADTALPTRAAASFCPAPDALDFVRSWQATPTRPAELQRTFSLGTLFLWVTLASMVLGAARIHPMFGVLLAVASVPASIATVRMARRRQRRGRPMKTAEKVISFVAAAGVVWPLLYFTWFAFALVGGVAIATVFGIGWIAERLADWLTPNTPAFGQVIVVLFVAIAVGLVATFLATRVFWPFFRNAVNGIFNVWKSLLAGEMF
jgi:hypothetical protein